MLFDIGISIYYGGKSHKPPLTSRSLNHLPHSRAYLGPPTSVCSDPKKQTHLRIKAVSILGPATALHRLVWCDFCFIVSCICWWINLPDIALSSLHDAPKRRPPSIASREDATRTACDGHRVGARLERVSEQGAHRPQNRSYLKTLLTRPPKWERGRGVLSCKCTYCN